MVDVSERTHAGLNCLRSLAVLDVQKHMLVVLDVQKWLKFKNTCLRSFRSGCYPWSFSGCLSHPPLTGWDEPHHPTSCDPCGMCIYSKHTKLGRPVTQLAIRMSRPFLVTNPLPCRSGRKAWSHRALKAWSDQAHLVDPRFLQLK